MIPLRSIGLCAAIVCVWLPSAVQALDVPETVHPILENHPSVLELRYKSSAEIAESEAKLGLPDPEASFGINNFPITGPSFDTYLPTNKAIGIQQKIPSLAIRHALSEKNREQSALFDLQSNFMIEQLFGQWQIASLTERSVAQRSLLLNKHKEAIERYLDSLESIAETGSPVAFEKISLLDLEKADLDIRAGELAEMSNVSKARKKAIAPELPSNAVEISQLPHERTILNLPFWAAELSNARHSVAKADVRNREAAYTPDFGVGLTYQQRERGRTFNGDDWVSFKVSMRIPFWSDQTHDNRLAAAKSRENAARSSSALALRSAQEKWENLIAQKNTALDTIEKLNEKLRAFDETLNASRNAYESGRGDVLSFHVIELKKLEIQDRILEQQLNADITLVSLHMLKRNPS